MVYVCTRKKWTGIAEGWLSGRKNSRIIKSHPASLHKNNTHTFHALAYGIALKNCWRWHGQHHTKKSNSAVKLKVRNGREKNLDKRKFLLCSSEKNLHFFHHLQTREICLCICVPFGERCVIFLISSYLFSHSTNTRALSSATWRVFEFKQKQPRWTTNDDVSPFAFSYTSSSHCCCCCGTTNDDDSSPFTSYSRELSLLIIKYFLYPIGRGPVKGIGWKLQMKKKSRVERAECV